MNNNSVPLVQLNTNYRILDNLPNRLSTHYLFSSKFKNKVTPQFAHQIVANFIKTGFLKRKKKCSMCNKHGKILAHHPNYLRPLLIIWLCAKCHFEWHQNYEKKNGMTVTEHYSRNAHEAPLRHSYLTHYHRRRNLIYNKFS